ncbi:MAG: ATP-dependent zinc metalloprotease FtsH, partial [Oscillospiraceae bacterium]|nr:ATP-dependent zinc metalloprotease FtsH [Oscillospiraceae bacterium]
MMNKKSSGKGLLIYVLVLVSAISLAVILLKQSTRTEAEYSYSEIMNYFDNYQVSEMTFDLGSGELEMVVEGQEKPIAYTVPNVSVFLNEIQMG